LVRISRRSRLTVVAVIVVVLGILRFVELRRLAVPLLRDPGAAQSQRLEREQMMLDLGILASERFGGRATDTPGGGLAAQLVASRFTQLGLSSFGGHFEQPFSFVHRSIRALWRRNRPFSKTFTEARNVVGYVPGTSAPSDFIVVSAHFDHLGVFGGATYHGADDNASGTSAMLAIATYVRTHPLQHSVVFAAFDAEELGLRGSRAFVDALPFPREHLRLDINVDMIGRSDDGRLIVSGVPESPELRPVVEAAARSAAVRVHLGHDRPMYLTGFVPDWRTVSDHGSFRAIGVPYLYFGVEDHADMHQPTDTADRIDEAFYGAAAETVLTALIEADRR
jgi:Zn-dependent M28 family amino/carboxypeptidase